MSLALRDVLLRAFRYWNCPVVEEERNLFRVEIEAGSVAEAVCEATGAVYIGIEEFEEDVIASYEVWRSFTPGSYYLHRLLERLSEGPVTGLSRASALYQSPPMADMLSLRQILSPDCLFLGVPERQDLSVSATTFHFAVSLLGVEPKTELVSVTVEPLRMNALPESSTSGPWSGPPKLPGELKTEETFPAAAKELKVRVAGLLEAYKQKRSGETSEAIRNIRAAKKADLAALSDPGGVPELLRRRAEVEELWTIREQDARIRGEAERIDISLVAATIQERPMTLYRVGLLLPGERPRTLERLYDRASDWVEPLRCEVCLRPVDAYVPGDGPCAHLMCGECARGGGGCVHAGCQECAPRCNRCRERICPLCLSPCMGCGKVACPSHRATCSECSRSICNMCSPPCSECAKRSCPIHGVRCPVCGQVLCSIHRKHKPEAEMFRMPYKLASKLGVGEVWVSKLDGRTFRGRKAFLDALREAFGEEFLRQHRSRITKNAERCYHIWVEGAVRELIAHAETFSESEQAFSPENWPFPFILQPEDKLLVWEGRDISPNVVVSLDDVTWWMRQSQYLFDPFLNEYGFLPDGDHGESLEQLGSEQVLLLGWFEHDRDSDPTQDTIPFYDPGAVDNLAVGYDENDEGHVVFRAALHPAACKGFERAPDRITSYDEHSDCDYTQSDDSEPDSLW